MADTIYANGLLETFAGGTLTAGVRAVVLTRTRAQIADGFPSWHPRYVDPLVAPFDGQLDVPAGTAKIYALNPQAIFPRRGPLVLGGHGRIARLISEHRGTFEDFAIFEWDTAASYFADDPVDGYVTTDNIGAVTGVGDLTTAWTRHYRVFYPPKSARYAVPHLALGSVAAGKSHFFDAFQMEVLPLAHAASPSAFEPARQINVKVRPAAKNFSTNPSFEVDLTDWAAGGSVLPALTRVVNRPKFGGACLQVTWANAGTQPSAQHTLTGLDVGRTYWASMWLRVPTGSPMCQVTVAGTGKFSPPTSVWGQWQRVWLQFTATSTTHLFQVWPMRAPVSGEQVFVDGCMVSESLVDYFDGSFGADYLWKQGGVPHKTQSYYYPDRSNRHYILVRTLQENVALGVSVSSPEYATT